MSIIVFTKEDSTEFVFILILLSLNTATMNQKEMFLNVKVISNLAFYS